MSRHRFHGDPARFEVVAAFIADRFPDARYVADVAGGQGMLTRILRKRFGFDAELIDPRSWSLKGVPVRAEHFVPSMAEIAEFHDSLGGSSEQVALDFKGPKNRALVLLPAGRPDPDARTALR